MIVGVPAEIWNEQLPKKKSEHHRYTNLLGTEEAVQVSGPDSWANPALFVAQIMSRFGPDSNGTIQTLYKTFRTFLDHSLFANERLFVQAFILS
jgi:hypothetical protein